VLAAVGSTAADGYYELLASAALTEKWPTLVTNSLCAAISAGKGGAVLEWLRESGVETEKWPTLVTNSLCAAISAGKGGAVLEWLQESGVETEKWPTLVTNSL
jgi:hypothetical protein